MPYDALNELFDITKVNGKWCDQSDGGNVCCLQEQTQTASSI